MKKILLIILLTSCSTSIDIQKKEITIDDSSTKTVISNPLIETSIDDSIIETIYKPFEQNYGLETKFLTAIINCRTQCTFTFFLAEVTATPFESIQACNYLCLKEFSKCKDPQKYTNTYNKPVPKKYFNEWVNPINKAIMP